MNPIKIYLPLFFLLFVLPLSLSAQNFQWLKAFGGVMRDKPGSIITDEAGNVYMSGYFGAQVDFNPGEDSTNVTATGYYDIYLIKFNSNGDFMWVKTFGGIDNDNQSGYNGCKLAIDASNNIYMTGGFKFIADLDPGPGIVNRDPNGSYDIFISKFDPDGNLIWNQVFGSNGRDFPDNIVFTPDNHLVIAGTFGGTMDVDASANVFNLFSNAQSNAFALKINTEGDFVWAKSFGNSVYTSVEGVDVDPFDNVLLTGTFIGTVDFDPGAGTSTLTSSCLFTCPDSYILQLNSAGDFSRAQKVGGEEYVESFELIADNIGNFYITGDEAYTFDLDPGPGTIGCAPPGFYKSFLIKFDNSGNYINSVCWGGDYLDAASTQMVMLENKLLISGYYSGIIEFGDITFNNSANDGANVFLFYLDENLDPVWTYDAGSGHPETPSAIHSDSHGYFYLAGEFDVNTYFDDANPVTVNSHGNSDVFLTKYYSAHLEVKTIDNSTISSIVPNPTSGKINIQLDIVQISVEIKLFNALGQEITTTTYDNASQIDYEIPGESGVYFLSITSGTGSSTFKVIKE